MQIAEVSEKYKISHDTLRYYERIGLIPRVNRNRGGIRDFTEEDERWVEFTVCMRGAGLSIEVLIEYVSLFQQGEKTNAARKALLVEQRSLLAARIEDMKKTLERLDYKIERYDQVLLKKERTMSGFNDGQLGG
ncbi:MAG: transcriptional regulator [Treponema sp. GWB1_62_6]|nr:MAG: transcriptional regulator [Treponema sp. GWA1_62_8]OHE68944.1 MAG: transcriptional regulator [Treponema sp. GWB1_62_6]OHE69160.1 MAG: transcriptional regulator [Treponema sp. GWC1_61_84]OHE75452.1 MAG: transcriptional regulator [Treponema sp. RIFOXYC1_FULL_61_9]HCM27794.1 MerR family transcriptional regulator [Treponema sp.]